MDIDVKNVGDFELPDITVIYFYSRHINILVTAVGASRLTNCKAIYKRAIYRPYH